MMLIDIYRGIIYEINNSLRIFLMITHLRIYVFNIS